MANVKISISTINQVWLACHRFTNHDTASECFDDVSMKRICPCLWCLFTDAGVLFSFLSLITFGISKCTSSTSCVLMLVRKPHWVSLNRGILWLLLHSFCLPQTLCSRSTSLCIWQKMRKRTFDSLCHSCLFIKKHYSWQHFFNWTVNQYFLNSRGFLKFSSAALLCHIVVKLKVREITSPPIYSQQNCGSKQGGRRVRLSGMWPRRIFWICLVEIICSFFVGLVRHSVTA